MRFRSVVPIILAVFSLWLVSCSKPKLSDRVQESLVELDGYVASRPVYETRKRGQLDALRKLLQSSTDPVRRFDLSKELADEYFAYNFDSTQFYLLQCLDIARAEGDAERLGSASISLGHLYAKSGHFMEAYNRLYERIDKESLPESLRADYLFALYDFCRDLAGNSGMAERLSIPDRAV